MSDDDKAFEYQDFGLAALEKVLTGVEVPQAKVGVLGDKTNRRDGASNAQIGMNHEFGEVVKIAGKDYKLPVRSFLRIPIIEHLQKYLEESGAFDQAVIQDLIKTKDIQSFVKKIGVVGERIVADAFDTGGFGKWTPSNMHFKKNHQTLVETQQLRNSITSEVE